MAKDMFHMSKDQLGRVFATQTTEKGLIFFTYKGSTNNFLKDHQ